MLKKKFLMAVGLLAVALGTLGVFLPLLPTTPFLLLAAACFMRSSESLHGWLLEHRWFGKYIRNYSEHRAITLKSKIIAIAVMWSSMLFSIYLVREQLWLQLLLALIALGVTRYLLSLKTMPVEPRPVEVSGSK